MSKNSYSNSVVESGVNESGSGEINEKFNEAKKLLDDKLKTSEVERQLVFEFFYKAYDITIFWISILCFVLFLQFFLPTCPLSVITPYSFCGVKLPTSSFNVLFGSTTITIIGLWGTAGYLLYKNKSR